MPTITVLEFGKLYRGWQDRVECVIVFLCEVKV